MKDAEVGLLDVLTEAENEREGVGNRHIVINWDRTVRKAMLV
jgi:hypothetical protein